METHSPHTEGTRESGRRHVVMETRRKSCLRIVICAVGLLFNIINILLGLCGLIIIAKALAMFKDWDEEHGHEGKGIPVMQLWFVWSTGFLGLYVFLVPIFAFIGIQSKIRCFIALSILMTLILLLAETGVILMKILHVDWEARLPADHTHQLEKLMDLLRTYSVIGWWTCLAIWSLQTLNTVFGITLLSMPLVTYEEWSDGYEAGTFEADADVRHPLLHTNQSLQSPSPQSVTSWPLSPGSINVISQGSGSGGSDAAVQRYSQSMRERYGVDSQSFSGYDPERQAPVIEETIAGDRSRRCSIM